VLAGVIEQDRATALVADAAIESRDAVADVLERSGRFDVVRHEGDGFEAVGAATDLQPAVTVLAVSLPRLSGFEALRYVRAAVPDGVVIVTSAPTTALCSLLDHGPGATPEERSLDLPASVDSAARARAFVERELRARRRNSIIGVATLLVSEIVTNAVVHARSSPRVSVATAPDRARVQVTDWGDGAVIMRDLGPLSLGGRGLHIVDRLADVWGTVSTPQWKTVWFELTGTRRHPLS
jgi:chemotaxis response regulator CheB